MKTSIAIFILLFVNTTALLSEPISNAIKDINLWVFLGIEILLVVAYYVNTILKDMNKAINPTFNVKYYPKKLKK